MRRTILSLITLLGFAVPLMPGGCSGPGDTLPVGDAGSVLLNPTDLQPGGTCGIGVHLAQPNGSCLVEWLCQDAGTYFLSCSPGDGGIACACATSGKPPVMTNLTPASCTDLTQLTLFARNTCGWSSL